MKGLASSMHTSVCALREGDRTIKWWHLVEEARSLTLGPRNHYQNLATSFSLLPGYSDLSNFVWCISKKDSALKQYGQDHRWTPWTQRSHCYLNVYWFGVLGFCSINRSLINMGIRGIFNFASEDFLENVHQTLLSIFRWLACLRCWLPALPFCYERK